MSRNRSFTALTLSCLLGIIIATAGFAETASDTDPLAEREPPRSQWATENASSRTHFDFGTQQNTPDQKAVSAYVIPIKGGINKAQLYILRRGLKEANARGIDAVILDMDTPGGDLGTTLAIMETLERFKGESITYVNSEAISAGSFIAMATDSIYFAPNGIMGAAEAVQSTGQDVNESMKRKIESYLDARVRTLTRKHRYRADVQRAMMKPDYELKIGETVLSPEGDLLSLTAEEAATEYGKPPVPLLADGIVDSIPDLLKARHGDFDHSIRIMHVSWAEQLARWLNAIAPLLMGAGMLLLFIEFKTPGFGVFGIGGLVLLGIVFTSHYVAALAGYEAILAFVLGVVLIFLELFILPGILIAGVMGFALVLGSLIWAMTDIWPDDSLKSFDYSMLIPPAQSLLWAILIAIVGIVLLSRFLPRSWFLDKLILSTGSSPEDADEALAARYTGSSSLPPEGSRGVTVTSMFPSGEVEIDGHRYLARVQTDFLEKGTPIIVVENRAFQLIVKEDAS